MTPEDELKQVKEALKHTARAAQSILLERGLLAQLNCEAVQEDLPSSFPIAAKATTELSRVGSYGHTPSRESAEVPSCEEVDDPEAPAKT